jgi:hypothetical protein
MKNKTLNTANSIDARCNVVNVKREGSTTAFSINSFAIVALELGVGVIVTVSNSGGELCPSDEAREGRRCSTVDNRAYLLLFMVLALIKRSEKRLFWAHF